MEIPQRVEGLFMEPMGEDLLVYSEQSQQAYFLKAGAARLLEQCDGSRSWAELSELADFEQSLAELRQHGLLQGVEQLPRRRFLQSALVLAVAAPSPALAASVVGGPSGCCITNIQCGSLAWTNTCRPCDVSNSNPADCSIPNSFCMRAFRVAEDINGDAVPGSCLIDSHAIGFPDQCDFVNPSNIWAQDCNAARAAVIAQGKPYAVYRCCNCS